MEQQRRPIGLEALAQGAIVALCAVVLLWPALMNGFPLVFMDTWFYLAPLFGQPAHVGRPAGYVGFEALLLTLYPSLWSIVVAQAVVTSLLLVRVAVVTFETHPRRLAWTGAALTTVILISGVAKYTSWLMPDVFTAWLFLTGVLFLTSAHRLDRALAIVIGTLALVSHNVHGPLATLTAALVAGVAWRAAPASRRLALTALVLVIGLGAAGNWLGNRLLDGRSEVLRGTSSFLANKFVSSGVMGATLDRYCDERPWEACQHRDWFVRHEGRGDDEFLFAFNSPFLTDMGAWVGDETAEIVRHSFRCCLPTILRTTVADTWKQFWSIDTADGIDSRRTISMRKMLGDLPIVAGLLEGRQARGVPVRLRVIALPEAALQAVLLALGLAVSVLSWRRGVRPPAWLFGALLTYLVLNAAISAFASTTHDRYQGRAAWLLSYVVVLAVGRAWPAFAGREAEDPMALDRELPYSETPTEAT